MKVIPEGSGADVKYYAQLGADAASKKLLGKRQIVTIATKESLAHNENRVLSKKYDIKSYTENYNTLTLDDFCLEVTSFTAQFQRQNNTDASTISKSYEPSTGIFTVTLKLAYAQYGITYNLNVIL